MLYYILFCYILFYFIILYFIILYFIILYFIILYYIILYDIILYYIILYYIILYYIMLMLYNTPQVAGPDQPKLSHGSGRRGFRIPLRRELDLLLRAFVYMIHFTLCVMCSTITC